MSKTLLKMCGITKNFPGVLALDSVDFTLRPGEIHALMGENGAGKSTLIKVLTGAETFESGEIYLDDYKTPIINNSPQEAQSRGISTVYQEVNLCPNLTVAENLFVGRQPGKAGFVKWGEMNKRAHAIMHGLGINIDVRKPLEVYSTAIQQMVSIARAIDISAKVLILDEPTSSLDEHEARRLFKLMRQLGDGGMGIVFVTHFLEQVYEVCDKITVLRNGRFVGEYDIEKLPRKELVAKMLGKAFDDLAAIRDASATDIDRSADPLVSAKGVGIRGGIHPFDLDIYSGEVVGLAGLLGSGRTELARAVYSADHPDFGNISVKGRSIKHTPLDAMKSGMGFCPENRKEEGVIADLSVRENLILAEQTKRSALNLMSRAEQERLAQEYIEKLQIKTASMETPVNQLSGGNQQKVIVARWLITHPDFLILDEPTRGIDVGTKTEIQKLILNLASQGVSVMFISSEIDEMLRTCGRVGIMRDTVKVGELSGDELSSAGIMSKIAGDEVDE
ncbi:MAG: sugar ABC transporter ATP-binding protein [Clostridiales bacterium]|nr:sugar ABC transporter ATP-binding protein [Clostridiales bacterium]